MAGTPRKLTALTVGGIIVFVVLLAFLLARAIGERAPGQTATGNDQTRTTAPSADAALSAAKAAVEQAPKSYDARIRYARR